jgi:hypothetical protein
MLMGFTIAGARKGAALSLKIRRGRKMNLPLLMLVLLLALLFLRLPSLIVSLLGIFKIKLDDLTNETLSRIFDTLFSATTFHKSKNPVSLPSTTNDPALRKVIDQLLEERRQERRFWKPKNVMAIVITIPFAALTGYVILSGKFGAEDQRWAFGMAGTVAGFWLKGSE